MSGALSDEPKSVYGCDECDPLYIYALLELAVVLLGISQIEHDVNTRHQSTTLAFIDEDSKLVVACRGCVGRSERRLLGVRKMKWLRHGFLPAELYYHIIRRYASLLAMRYSGHLETSDHPLSVRFAQSDNLDLGAAWPRAPCSKCSIGTPEYSFLSRLDCRYAGKDSSPSF